MSEETIEVNDEPQVEEKEFSVEGLLPEEVEMAKDQGLIKEPKEEEDEHKEQSEPEADKDKQEEQPEKEEEVKPTFDDVEADKSKLKKFNANEQALYWKWKNDKRKRQETERKAEELKAQLELEQVKESAREVKIKKIQEALKGEVTIEQLEAILGSEKSESDVLTKSDLEKIEAERERQKQLDQIKVQEKAERIASAEEIGKIKYDNFEEITVMADEVVRGDAKGIYRKLLDEAFNNSDVSEVELVEMVESIAKLNPKYGKKDSEKPEDSTVKRAVENAKKKVSSAAVGSSRGSRTVNYDDLTVEDAARLTTEQWMKLPDRVREKLLKG